MAEKEGPKFRDIEELFRKASPKLDKFYAERMGSADFAEQSMVRSSSRRARPVPGSSHLLPDVEPLSADPSSGTRNARPQTPKP